VKPERPGASPVLVPGVVSLAASSRRTLKHGDSFAMFDELGDIHEVEHSPAGLFHHDTRFLSRLQFTLEGHRPMALSSMTVKRLAIGEARVDLMLRRHDSSVAVNLLAREGTAEVEVML
jgi:N-terminal domain of (some) glycogen debranching enzymes